MSTVVNLKHFRKQKARAEKRSQADANSIKFGRSKAQKQQEAVEQKKARSLIEGHKLDPNT